MHGLGRLLACLTLVAPLSMGCGGGAENQPDAGPAVDGAGETAAAGTEAAAEADADGVPKIAADQAIHDFGGIKASDTVEHVFTIRNEGTADLKIERVQRT
jgi:hypothetical protein